MCLQLCCVEQCATDMHLCVMLAPHKMGLVLQTVMAQTVVVTPQLRRGHTLLVSMPG